MTGGVGRRTLGVPTGVDEREARAALSELAGWASLPITTDCAGHLVHPYERDTQVQRALREIMHEHAERMPSALVADAEAIALT